MNKKMSKSERAAFAQGCRVGARNSRRSSVRRSSTRTRTRYKSY